MDEIIKRPELAEDARREAEIRVLVADYHAKIPHIAELPNLDCLLRIIDSERAKSEGLRAALEEIAQEHDAGRHDGLPEPCPALDADTMFAIACAALSASPSPTLPEEDEGDYGRDPEKLRKLLGERDAFIVESEMWAPFMTWLARLDASQAGTTVKGETL